MKNYIKTTIMIVFSSSALITLYTMLLTQDELITHSSRQLDTLKNQVSKIHKDVLAHSKQLKHLTHDLNAASLPTSHIESAQVKLKENNDSYPIKNEHNKNTIQHDSISMAGQIDEQIAQELIDLHQKIKEQDTYENIKKNRDKSYAENLKNEYANALNLTELQERKIIATYQHHVDTEWTLRLKARKGEMNITDAAKQLKEAQLMFDVDVKNILSHEQYEEFKKLESYHEEIRSLVGQTPHPYRPEYPSFLKKKN